MADDTDFHTVFFTGPFHNFLEVILKRVLFVFSTCLALSACQKANDLIIDNPQQIVNATHLTFLGSDSIDIAGYHATTPPSFGISDTFTVTLSSTEGFSHLEVTVENDSSTVLYQQDYTSLEGNSISGNFSFFPASVYVGSLVYKFTPYDINGVAGNYIIQSVSLFNSSTTPPVIDSVTVPDSVQINPNYSVIVDLYAKVHDPYGLGNIAEVYFNSTKPDGTPATGNPYLMYDDGGANGGDDQIAGDGIYTLGITLPPTTTPGIYRFVFYAVNRSGVSSAPVSHNIKVYK